MEDTFLRKWGEKKDHEHCLTEFSTLKKRHNEGVSEFIKRFNKLYLDLLEAFFSSSKFNTQPELKKVFLEVLVERYEAEIEILNTQEWSYHFRDPRAFLESLPPPKKEEIPLPFEVQEENYRAFKSHIKDTVEDAIIKAS